MQTLRQDGEFVLLRARRDEVPELSTVTSGFASRVASSSILVLAPVATQPSTDSRHRLEHELALTAELDPHWAVRPLALTRHEGRPALLLEDPGGEPLERRIGQCMELTEFLSLAIAITADVAQAHARGLIHKDLKPANILVNDGGQVFLTGFGIASLSPRERQIPKPPEVLAGTLQYMAPEQTGRMNRSIDARSDLYSLGVTFFELLTGKLPFAASDPLDWVHCHMARRPTSPREYFRSIPDPIARILLKLLAKAAEERYQTASGLEADWRHCLEAWQSRSRIEAFALAQHDAPDHLVIPEALYGREHELARLRSAHQEVATLGVPVLMLISGYAGVGKSAIVHEFRRELMEACCWFAAGKCDQSQREIPYATLMKMFGSLVRELLGHSAVEITQWRERLLEALGGKGQLIVTLIPELELVIGPQSPLPEVPPQDALNRFRRVMRRFVGAFAAAEHPLVLFLDDLQWVDTATLDLLEHLLTEPDVRHLLVIGAYRDHEVEATHPFPMTIERLLANNARVEQMELAPLQLSDIERLVAEALHCAPERIAELAELVHLKTHGNPFFAIQFLTNLEQERLLQWHGASAGWCWDLPRIRAKGFTDNVAHLLVARLNRLSQATLTALQRFACLGSEVDLCMLTRALEASEPAVHQAFAEAVLAGLVIRVDGSYRFLHDRVQEAAYALVPEFAQAALHLSLGRALCAHATRQEIEEHVFEIVSQLNRGRELILDLQERHALAELNLHAGKQARQSSAYAAALSYFTIGGELLPEDRWAHCHELAFALEFHRGECEFLTGALEEAEARLAALALRVSDGVEGAAIAGLRETIYEFSGRHDRAVEVCLDYLRSQGIVLLAAPTDEEVQEEYARLWRQIGSRTVEQLLDLPIMTNPRERAILDVLVSLLPAAYCSDNANLLPAVILRMANLSLEHGNSDGSALAYSYLNYIVGLNLGEYDLGYRFGKLAVDLLDRGMHRFKARVELMFAGTIIPWTRPLRSGLDWLHRCMQSAEEAGDLIFACYSRFLLTPCRLCAGDPLEEVQYEAEEALHFARHLRSYTVDLIEPQVAFLRALRGFTAELSCFTAKGFDETIYEKGLLEHPGLDDRRLWYWVRKLQACFHAGDYRAAIEAAARVGSQPWRADRSPYMSSERHFYTALARAALYERASAAEQREHRKALDEHARSLAVLAANSAENFGARAHLVAAELSRIERQDAQAQRYYEQAIRAARQHDHVNDEAVALEMAGRFYASRGLDSVAHALLRRAYSCFERWGATAKLRLLERRYPELAEHSPTTPGAAAAALSTASIIKAAQAVSGEIVPENLVRTLLTLAVKEAGAERALLILMRDQVPYLEAEAKTDESDSNPAAVAVTVKQTAVTGRELPETILRYVTRTGKNVILDDATRSPYFPADDYLREHRPRAVLCTPITRQGRLIGELYLENKMVAGAFTATRLAVLDVLAAQAAISLENAYLYSDLRERESRIRRLVESNIIGVYFWSMSGAITDANDALLDLLGYSRAELMRGRITWRGITPPEYQELDQRVWAQFGADGKVAPYEKELVRKDATRVPVLTGHTLLEGSPDHGITFVLDLTERRRAEIERSARRDAEVANRAKSEFLSSMSHELRTPLNCILGYAQLLERAQTLSERHRHGVQVIRRSGEHLLTLINDILDLAKVEAGRLELHIVEAQLLDVLRGVRDIIQIKAQEKSLTLVWDTTPDLPEVVRVDERRLRQVLLNLLANAVKFTDYGEVRLMVRRLPGDLLHFEVQDTGIGIPEDQLGALFQPFEQVGEPRRRTGGTGLGLAISQQLVRMMGGEIHVESRVGEGSRFWFVLEPPIVTDVLPAPAGLRYQITGYEGTRKTILVVDDMAENRKVLVDLLAPLGFTLIEAENGQQALDKAATLQPDLIILDYLMPVMDGQQATRRLRQLPTIGAVPVIMFSARATCDDEAECLASGANAFMAKPVDLEQLLNLIATLLKLEWNVVAPVSAAEAEALAPVVTPPAEQMEALYHLAREGNMRKIMQWAEEMAARDARYHPFTDQLARLAKQYQSHAILKLVEAHLGSPIPAHD